MALTPNRAADSPAPPATSDGFDASFKAGADGAPPALGTSTPHNPFAPPDESTALAQSRSLFGEIMDWMLAPLLLLWPMSIAVTYLVAKSIANGPFDRSLETDVYVLARQIQPVNATAIAVPPDSARAFLRADDTDTIYYQIIGPHGELIAGTQTLPPPINQAKLKPGVVEFRDEALHGTPIRVAYTSAEISGRAGQPYALVQVAETLDKRNRLANDIIKGVILPQFVILPLAIVLVWFGLTRGLAPLHALQTNIRARRPDDLSPLETAQAPAEIAPLVTSFNELLTRLEHNVELQKRFIADAAHQMKTPLAGLRMQAEFASRQTVSDEVRRSLEYIATSSEQAARLVSQLLTLARAESSAAARAFEPVDLVALGRWVTHHWVPPALDKQMDLGFDGPEQPVWIAGNALMLQEMFGNLLDNSIRYTPRGGRITLRLSADAAHVYAEVEDTGPGIPPSERAHVMERFYRILGRGGEGSGLGLAIVREIALAHRGEISIHDHVYETSPGRVGTLIKLIFPHLPRQDLP